MGLWSGCSSFGDLIGQLLIGEVFYIFYDWDLCYCLMAAASYVLITYILILSFVYSNPEKLGYTELVYNAASDS